MKGMILPCKSIIFPKYSIVNTAVFDPSHMGVFDIAQSLYQNIEEGKIILCETIKNNQWYGHRIDFLLQRTESGWQPYVVEYDVEKPSPMKYDCDGQNMIRQTLITDIK